MSFRNETSPKQEVLIFEHKDGRQEEPPTSFWLLVIW
jgi:hypothetical protein